jgi:hypothetical protein
MQRALAHVIMCVLLTQQQAHVDSCVLCLLQAPQGNDAYIPARVEGSIVLWLNCRASRTLLQQRLRMRLQQHQRWLSS